MVNFEYKPHYGWEDFLEIMHLLRGPGGCPWDREQTHSSIRRNFLEETYEVLDALDRDDVAGMKEELGDILMQVAFHSIMEEEVGRFNIDDVVDGVSKKLVFRHPHVFGSLEGKDSQQALTNWEEAKRKEKGFNSVSDAIEAVPHTLPALWRAEKIISKTVKAGFNWSSISGALDKLDEEAGEVRQAVEKNVTGPHGMQEEIGDALFALTKIAQMNGIDPEEALHLACDKFEGRFRKVEEAATQPLKSYSEAELIALWEDAKQS
ncbi:MAG: nucleoside triphosphate pyrophosphohydrolase [Oscillibacter sp.]|nr:nucleoside triphosphate pyrophosphohydrolase [Oscillibacter sp.]